MAIGLFQHPGDKRELLGTHAHVEGAVGVGEEVRRPRLTEGFPLLRRKGVVCDTAFLLSLLLPAVIAEGDVVGGSVKVIWALSSSISLPTSTGLVASPQSRRWGPSFQTSPGFTRGLRWASSRAASRSNCSGLSRFSRVSRLRSSFWRSSSPKPVRVRASVVSVSRSCRRRASSSSSKEPAILLRATFKSRALNKIAGSFDEELLARLLKDLE